MDTMIQNPVSPFYYFSIEGFSDRADVSEAGKVVFFNDFVACIHQHS